MTLDDLELQNRVVYGFFGNFALRDTFQEQIAPKSIEIDMDRLLMKSSAFNGPSIDFLGSKNLRTKASKTGIPIKVIILPLLVFRQNGCR